ncbi:hypothetical protein D9611_011619 [Ephemerocybe angulata]|uniref:Transmembrane protein n=1 Tax=Ephemerocybe angulata TaxID=980116 RepID=A0A8H5AV13_9AGAR|nr:hypothetical protein D9611_011619 [Tulosesus angulatus]
MLLSRIPRLEYSITRPFDSPWVSALAYALGFITIVILTIVNVALVGYETVSEFRSDFNSTKPYWFDAFTPSFASRSQPGKQCAEHVFDVGDSLITNSSLFDWKVDAVFKANAGETGFSYKGGTLENCDVVQVTLFGDLNTWTVEGEILMMCKSPDSAKNQNFDLVELAGVAKFGVSALPAKQTNFQRLAKNAKQGSIMYTLGNLLAMASVDIGNQVYTAYLASNNTGLISYSLVAEFEPCPPSYANTPLCDNQRLTQPPLVNITDVNAVSNNRTLSEKDVLGSAVSFQLDESLLAPTLNFLQLARAAGRVDLGNTAPNNFLTNLSMTDTVLKSQYPSGFQASVTAPSQLYAAWKSQVIPLSGGVIYAPLQVLGPAVLQTEFICHFSRLKSPGSLIVAVLVATLSMFSSAWGLSIVLAARIVKRRGGDEANRCTVHSHSTKPMAETDPESRAFEDGEKESASRGYEDKEYRSTVRYRALNPT